MAAEERIFDAPAARAEDVVDVIHGVGVRDPWRWLEDGSSQEVRDWATRQDNVARTLLSRYRARKALKARFTELFYVDSTSPPVRRGNRFFYLRTHADREKAVVYWRDGEQGEEKVLLDPNGWSESGNVSLGRWVPSWDGRKVVYAKKENAADEATLYVLEVESGKDSEIDVIEGGKYASPVWTPDNRSFYYEWLPTDPSIPVERRPGFTELRLHVLGSDPKDDPIVHPRTNNPSTFLSGDLSRDGRFLFAYIHHGWNATDVYVRELGKDPHFRLLVGGTEATYSVEAHGEHFYVLTDEGGPKRRLFRVPVQQTERRFWKEIVGEDPDATLEWAAVMGGKLMLGYLRNAASELRIHALDGPLVRKVALPDIGTVHAVTGDPERDEFFFSYNSFTRPTEVYRSSIREGTQEVWANVDLPIDPSRFVVEQVFYPSRDGTKVSMFLVRSKELKKDGNNPVLLYGYGGFNVSLRPSFAASIYPWLEAGGIYAVPNLRGGGEYGRAWHEAGRGHRKQNVFDDFIAAAEHLVEAGWTRSERIGIMGGSNGGLLVGAAMTQRPELFGAVVCSVPLLDMVRYHLFGSGRTWIPEYGSAEKPGEFRTLLAYSPYHRVKANTAYPPLLMMAADSDDRVDPMHARKFVAAVQAVQQGRAPTLLRVEENAGHGGADLIRQSIDSAADRFAFLFEMLGVSPPGTERKSREYREELARLR